MPVLILLSFAVSFPKVYSAIIYGKGNKYSIFSIILFNLAFTSKQNSSTMHNPLSKHFFIIWKEICFTDWLRAFFIVESGGSYFPNRMLGHFKISQICFPAGFKYLNNNCEYLFSLTVKFFFVHLFCFKLFDARNHLET